MTRFDIGLTSSTGQDAQLCTTQQEPYILKAVRVLLDEGAAINAESKPIEAFEDVLATEGCWSALDFALRGKLDGAPDRIKAGGSSEIRAW